MFGFTTILSASLSLLLVSARVGVIASPAPRTLLLSLYARQSDSDGDIPIASQCATQCNKLNASIASATTPAQLCTNAIVSQFAACFDCEAAAGDDTVGDLQDAVDEFVTACADDDHPVNGVTIVAKNVAHVIRVPLVVLIGLAALSLVGAF